MKKKHFILIIILLFLAFFAKDLVMAQNSTELENPLRYNDIKDLINAIIDFLFKVSIPLAGLLFIIGGFMMVMSAGDTWKLERAKNLFLYTAIGFTVILLAKGLVLVLKSVLGVKETVFFIINFFV
jgi:hypothetical protein